MADGNNQPAAAAAAPQPPVAVMPAPANNNMILVAVCLWACVNTGAFSIVAIIADHTRCRKWTWVYQCLALTADHTTAAELSALFAVGLLCSTVAGLTALLHMVLTEKTSCTSRSCGRWAVGALAWVALAATAAVHGTEVATGCIALAAHPDNDTFFCVHVFLASLCLIVDLLFIAGLLLCSCSRRRRKLGEHGDGEPV